MRVTPERSTVPDTLGHLETLTSEIQSHAYAAGSMRNLKSHWKSYVDFCRKYNLQYLPASPTTISHYAVFLSCRTSSFQYILNHLNVIRLFHLYNQQPCSALDSFEVSLTKKGLKRLLGVAPKQKKPITLEMLQGFKYLLDLRQPLHTGLWCLFTVAFFSFLRKSNLTVESSNSFDPTIHFTRQDLKFTPTGALLRIKWSKTIQHKERCLYIPLPCIPGSELCPVQAISDY